MRLVRESSRADRKHNIAVMLLEASEKRKSERDYITAQSLRKKIRERLGLPELLGEEHIGDLRAHGDAYGGHGLCLNVRKSRDIKAIFLNDENIEICKDHLKRCGNVSLGEQVDLRDDKENHEMQEIPKKLHEMPPQPMLSRGVHFSTKAGTMEVPSSHQTDTRIIKKSPLSKDDSFLVTVLWGISMVHYEEIAEFLSPWYCSKKGKKLTANHVCNFMCKELGWRRTVPYEKNNYKKNYITASINEPNMSPDAGPTIISE